MVRMDAVTPIHVTLQNDDTERNGSVAVSLFNAQGEVSRATRVVALPPQARKAVFLYLPATSEAPTKVRIRYTSERHTVVSETTESVTPLNGLVPVTAVIGSPPPGLPEIQDAEGNQLGARVFLTPDQLPDRWEGLQMYDAIILATALDHPLETSQITALRDWVLRGGVLAIVADKKTDGLMALASDGLLSFTPLALEEVALDRFGGATTEVMTGTVERATTLLESNGYPLGIRRNAGLGSIVCVMMPFDAPAVRGWDGWTDFWHQAFAHLTIPAGSASSYPSILTSPESRTSPLIAAAKPPQQPNTRTMLVAVLSVLYILAIGPADYNFVRRLRKPYLTWVTFSVIVAVFTAGSWFGAKHLVGGDMQTQFIRRTLYVPANGSAVQCTLTSLFAPATDTYVVSDRAGSLMQPIRPSTSIWQAQPAPCIGNAPFTVTDHLPIWNYRVYLSSTTVNTPPAVTLRIDMEEGVRVAHIANLGSFPLHNCRVCFGNRAWNIVGPIEPGSESAVLMTETTSQGFPEALYEWSFMRMGSSARASGPPSPLVREMSGDAALARGAVILVATIMKESTDALTVNGSSIEGTCREKLEVVVYPEQDGP